MQQDAADRTPPPTDGVMKDDSNKCSGDPPAVALQSGGK